MAFRPSYNLRIRAVFLVLFIGMAGVTATAASALASALNADASVIAGASVWSVWGVEMLLYLGMCLLLYRARMKEVGEATPEYRAAEAKRLKTRYAVTGSVLAAGLGLVVSGLQSNLTARLNGEAGPAAEGSSAYLWLKTVAVAVFLVLLVLKKRRNARRP